MDQDEYVKASAFNLSAQRHNHQVFIRRLSVGQACAMAGVAGLFAVLIHEQDGGARGVVLAAICGLFGLYFAVVASQKASGSRE
jgi:hypothetical protein